MGGGAVLSDLHLFSKRTDDARVDAMLDALPHDLEFLVLNGDIFDFRWTRYGSEEETVTQGVAWVERLLQKFPHTRVRYIMGNHDCSQSWSDGLSRIKHDRFDWSPTHTQIGAALFLHGDLPLRGQNPFHRELPASFSRMPAFAFMSALYDRVVEARVHNLFKLVFSACQCVPKIHAMIGKHDPVILSQISDVYFGHTHVPFDNFPYKNLRYHNTGSGVRHMPANVIRFNHGR